MKKNYSKFIVCIAVLTAILVISLVWINSQRNISVPVSLSGATVAEGIVYNDEILLVAKDFGLEPSSISNGVGYVTLEEVENAGYIVTYNDDKVEVKKKEVLEKEENSVNDNSTISEENDEIIAEPSPTEEPVPTETPETEKEPTPTVHIEEPKPTEAIEEPKPTAPVEEPKPTTPIEEPKPTTPIEEPKPTTPVEEPKPTAPVEEPKPTAPVEEPKEEDEGLPPGLAPGQFRNKELNVLDLDKTYDENLGKLNKQISEIYFMWYTPQLKQSGTNRLNSRLLHDPHANTYGIRVGGWRISYDTSLPEANMLNLFLETFYFLCGDKDVSLALWNWFDDEAINGKANTDDYGFTDVSVAKKEIVVTMNDINVKIIQLDNAYEVYFTK